MRARFIETSPAINIAQCLIEIEPFSQQFKSQKLELYKKSFDVTGFLHLEDWTEVSQQW